jgi:hypothetical protein
MSLLQGSALTPRAAAGSSAKGSLPAVALSTIPAVVAAAACVGAAAHAQHKKELFLHAALPLFAAGAITSFFPLLTRAHPALGFVALVLTMAFALAANPSISSILALLYKGPTEVVALPLFDAILTVGAVSPAARHCSVLAAPHRSWGISVYAQASRRRRAGVAQASRRALGRCFCSRATLIIGAAGPAPPLKPPPQNPARRSLARP